MANRDVRRYLRADFAALEAYTPVKPLDVLAAEIAVSVEQLVKLDANENLYGPIPEIREAVAAADFHIYPDPGHDALRAAIAEYVGATPDQIVAGAGADDLIDIVIRVAMPPAVVNCPPTFGMYGYLAKIAGARVVEVPRTAVFDVDVEGVARAVADGAPLVFLTSPNNPTGNPLPRADLERICELDALVVVDEAYIEFGGETAVPLIARYPNLVVLRTFSKWAGLAGLRVGYAIADPGLAAAMMATKQPYNVNVAAEVAARTALAHRARIFETVRCLVAERERLAREAGALPWLRPLPSVTNFVLFEVIGRDASEVAAALRRRGILIRHYQRPELRNYIRISAGRPEDTDRLLAALKEM